MEQVIIIGGACAGWTAAIYAARANLKPIIISGNEEGGQLMLTTMVENFPGFPEGIMGPELMERMKQQAKRFGARIYPEDATSFSSVKGGYAVKSPSGTFQAKSIIIATGARARTLGIPSEKKFWAKGVHTCATCDGFFYSNKKVMVIGGGDSACEEASFLSNVAKQVVIVHRRDTMNASKVMQDRVKRNKKITFLWNSTITEFKGKDLLHSVVLEDLVTRKKTEQSMDGVFLAIGHIPNTSIFTGKVELNEHGFLVVDRRMHTNLPGVFGAGDVQDFIYRQAITAAGTGCQAALEVERYLQG
ncbi:thioredoxin-disulfide reductase [Candidatus Woesearchaeota archaeon]|nr:thioredoxin-disulfide reductase [Candidatus Woesearchaeota archaeon]